MSRRAISRGAWALADQGLHSGASFGIHVALARWLPAQEYGLFAVLHALFLLLAVAHTSLLEEPLLVFGAGRFRRLFARYVRVLLELQGLVTLILLFPALLAGVMARALDLPPAVPELTVASVPAFSAILAQWLLRRGCYVRARPGLAAATSALYALLVGLGIVGLRGAGALSPAGAFGVMAGAALLSGAVPLAGLGILRGPRPTRRLRRAVRARHARFGRWTLLTNGLNWIPNNAFFLLLSAAQGLPATAALRALFNLILPFQHATSALSLVLLPALVRRRGPAAARLARRAALGFGICATAFSTALVIARAPLVDLVYAGRYASEVDLLWGLAVLPIVGGLIVVCRARLLAEERPDAVARAYVGGAAVTVIPGLPLVLWIGLTGAVVGRVAAALALGAALWRLQRSGRTGAGPELASAAAARPRAPSPIGRSRAAARSSPPP